ncbi:MAG: hypothetical protein KF752_11675 [Pirellulaceae bacterium]|nr:hypothetical protein [Pirellulaceae bacterium]
MHRPISYPISHPVGRGVSDRSHVRSATNPWTPLQLSPALILHGFDLATLFSDTGGTTPATLGGSVASVRDVSNAALLATQGTAANRPIMARHPRSGIRQLLLQTEAMNVSPWENTGLTAATESDPLGGSAAWRLTSNATTCRFAQPFVAATGENVVASVYMKQGTRSTERFRVQLTGGTPSARDTTYTWATGEFSSTTSGLTPTAEVIGGGWVRIKLATSIPAFALTPTFQFLRNGTDYTNGQYSIAWRPQVEIGTAETNYQKAVTAYDLTEADQDDIHYLWHDLSNDKLVVDFASGLGSNVTIFRRDAAGQTVQSGQSVGAGNWDVPFNSQRLYAVVVVPRALDESEATKLTNFYNGLLT